MLSRAMANLEMKWQHRFIHLQPREQTQERFRQEFGKKWDWEKLGPEGCARLQQRWDNQGPVHSQFFLTLSPMMALKFRVVSVEPEGLLCARLTDENQLLFAKLIFPVKLALDCHLNFMANSCHVDVVKISGNFLCSMEVKPRYTWGKLVNDIEDHVRLELPGKTHLELKTLKVTCQGCMVLKHHYRKTMKFSFQKEKQELEKAKKDRFKKAVKK